MFVSSLFHCQGIDCHTWARFCFGTTTDNGPIYLYYLHIYTYYIYIFVRFFLLFLFFYQLFVKKGGAELTGRLGVRVEAFYENQKTARKERKKYKIITMSDVFTGNSVDMKIIDSFFFIVVEFSLLYENKNKQIGAKKRSTASPETILYTLHTHTHTSLVRACFYRCYVKLWHNFFCSS